MAQKVTRVTALPALTAHVEPPIVPLRTAPLSGLAQETLSGAPLLGVGVGVGEGVGLGVGEGVGLGVGEGVGDGVGDGVGVTVAVVLLIVMLISDSLEFPLESYAMARRVYEPSLNEVVGKVQLNGALYALLICQLVA
ncbi:MAG TPA: hypothetical protein VFJ70_16805 [Burkholderiales bacterium]|nr:hypothetical protein [Burkholderiales bacterium]